MYDVIVVGGGPAGSTATGILSGGGLDICQIARDVGEKDCAGILTSQYVKRYGVDETYIERELDGIVLANDNHQVRLDFKGDYSINRREFDLHLFDLIDSGIQKSGEVTDIKVCKDHVRIRTDNGDYYSKVVIAADGADSCIVKKLNLGQNRVAECAQGVAKYKNGAKDRCYFNIFLNYAMDGYGWIAPKGDHYLVGIGSASQKVNINEFASRIGMDVSDVSYSKIPFYGPTKKTYTDRVLVVGDAAGFVTPFEGEGLYYACRSAEIASETILDLWDGGGFSGIALDSYVKKWKSEFGQIFSIFRFLTPFINNRHFVNAFLRILKTGTVNKFIINMINKNGKN